MNFVLQEKMVMVMVMMMNFVLYILFWLEFVRVRGVVIVFVVLVDVYNNLTPLYCGALFIYKQNGVCCFYIFIFFVLL
jgi:hypothetical protein